ncbi:hypothetical protein GGX14DRAFT_396446 [Mycena pura]|uniref:Uncharacterized protein n=1 Tax=Mycena pura TaxID=153505 RepID=A0AAD6YDS0_9AGAR|nr:hypothetical protein GGX14DRAFT_396446 [Mycena pura]
MSASATFCEIPLRTAFDAQSCDSLVSSEWILSAGVPTRQSMASGVLTVPSTDTIHSMQLKASVAADLPFDLVLGRDWLFFCRQTLPHTSFVLSSGVVFPGASADVTSDLHTMDVDTAFNSDNTNSSVSPRPDRSACRALAKDFESAAHMSRAVLKIILEAEHKKMATESLSHVAAALNIPVPGVRTMRFKLRAAIGRYADSISSDKANVTNPSVSVAEFFNSFESHRRPILMSIAALHRIEMADCADVCNEWRTNNLDPDLQVHVLTAIYGSNITAKSLRRVLLSFNIECDDAKGVKQLRRMLKRYITDLRRGKKAERCENQDRASRQKFETLTELEAIRQSWPQLIPQSVKNRCVRRFRDQTSSEALSTFTCASCAETVLLRSQCSIVAGDPHYDLNVLKRPDLKSDNTIFWIVIHGSILNVLHLPCPLMKVLFAISLSIQLVYLIPKMAEIPFCCYANLAILT